MDTLLYNAAMALALGTALWAAARHGTANTTSIVSRGIGMERAAAPRLRFLCRPQIVVVDLAPPSAR